MGIEVKILILLVVATGCLMFHQNDYKVKLDRMMVLWYNPNVLEHFKLYFFRYNRSVEQKLINGSAIFKIDFPNKIMFRWQVYKFASMEYRLFPINFTMDFCKMTQSDTFGTQDLWDHMNINCCCPFKKGPVVLNKYMLDQSKLPPHYPRGIFKADVTISIYDNVKVANVSIYYEIESVIRWQK